MYYNFMDNKPKATISNDSFGMSHLKWVTRNDSFRIFWATMRWVTWVVSRVRLARVRKVYLKYTVPKSHKIFKKWVKNLKFLSNSSLGCLGSFDFPGCPGQLWSWDCWAPKAQRHNGQRTQRLVGRQFLACWALQRQIQHQWQIFGLALFLDRFAKQLT